MSLFKRLKRILTPEKPVIVEKNILTLTAGDICEVSMVTYQVTGRTQNQSRNAVVLTLQDGSTIRYLGIEDREKTVFVLYEVIDGRLESLDEVPTILELDDHTYHLEEQFIGFITTSGKTPYMQGGEQSVWLYQSDDMRHLRIEWQDGRFMMFEGEPVLPGDVCVVRGK
ncbi:MAG: DUF4178 domain-containing protein [Gorillibacterium sp.]|nr:DUF4178 domain-containing protein [Gorillibacterium sp.]